MLNIVYQMHFRNHYDLSLLPIFIILNVIMYPNGKNPINKIISLIYISEGRRQVHWIEIKNIFQGILNIFTYISEDGAGYIILFFV